MNEFDELEATYLFCKKCGASMLVRKKLLLLLPDGAIWEYICSGCGSSIGIKKEMSGGEYEGE